MPYVTVMQPPKKRPISHEEVIEGPIDISQLFYQNKSSNTRTYYYENLPVHLVNAIDISAIIQQLERFNYYNSQFIDTKTNSFYKTFYIPKQTSGYRKIDAPQEPFKTTLSNLKTLFESIWPALHHTAAFAYVKHRSTIDALKKHQFNESHWYLKIDFSNFFGSTTLEFTREMLSKIFPFCCIMDSERGKEALTKSLQLCFLNGGLPQGTPMSPLLTNIIMLPIDYQLSNSLRNFNKKSYIYTRYADDIIISCKYDFQVQAIQEHLQEILNAFSAPFKINENKTRYGSRSGTNYNLGLKVNKDNQISVGHEQKKVLKSKISRYVEARNTNDPWDISKIQKLMGILSYYRYVEKDTGNIEYILQYYGKKYNIDILQAIKDDIDSFNQPVGMAL